MTTARVRYADTDQGGVAYHARYLDWFEVGRTEMLRDLGFPYARLERERDLLLTVVEAALRFRQPARYDDVLVVETALAELRRVRLKIENRITRQFDGEVLCTGYIWLACVTRLGRVAALPADFVEILSPAPPDGGKTPGAGGVRSAGLSPSNE